MIWKHRKGEINVEPSVWRQMGLTDEEYARIVELLGREPNYLEIGIFSVMWSEHCSYKTSKPVLKEFPTEGPQVLQGPGENAGIVDIGDGQAVVFKLESHNHPSAIEPFQGAATGVGGILRDVFTMGARPIAVLDSLRFGPLEDQENKYLLKGVVSGIASYGNSVGVPTVGGEVYFNSCYNGNPLVNAMAVGILEHKHITKGVASGVGNPVMVIGARTGRDGIHGATFASVDLDEDSEYRRYDTQVGDPYMEKLLMEACLELIQAGALVGIQDMAAAGLTSSSSEMASRGNSGVELEVSLVPCREQGMTPYEIMLSETQERMLIIPKAGKEKEVRQILAKWGIEAAVIGRVTDDGMLRILENGQKVAEIPVKALTEKAPVYHRTAVEPKYYQELKSKSLSDVRLKNSVEEVFLTLLAQPTIASKEWLYRRYDHQAGATVVAPGAEAGIVRIKGTRKGLAMTVDCNSRYVYLDPYVGAALAVVEAAQNLVCAGARPLAITDCLNFGNPEKPEIFWQFKQACAGISAACKALNTPVVSGNVSFYNETSDKAIHPTPTIGMIGLLEDVDRILPNAFRSAAEQVYLLGEPEGELAGSEYLAVYENVEAGALPELNLPEIKNRLEFLLELNQSGLLLSAHDIAEGGLAVALAEMTKNIGVKVNLNLENSEALTVLFGERLGRFIISAPKQNADKIEALAAAKNIPLFFLGETGGSNLQITFNGQKCLDLNLGKYRPVYEQSIAKIMDGTE